MSRVLLVLLTASIALAAPAPKATVSLYHPTKVGDKRVYERESRGGNAGGVHTDEFTEVVTAVESKDGGFVVSVRRDDSEADFAFLVTGKGIFVRMTTDDPFDRSLLKLPAKKGETWDLPSGSTRAKTVYTIGGEEEVKVPAGTFKAIRVDSTTELPLYTAKISTWYAPEVGVVKMWYSGGAEVTHVLKSFTSGKK